MQGDHPPWRVLRQAHGLSLRQMADQARIDPAHLSRVERGLAQLSVPALARLADALGLRELAQLLRPFLEANPRRPHSGKRRSGK
jgi:transcriptional regulator with XRE-family HTH domain